MDWTTADPVAVIEQRIRLIEADQRAWQHQLADAHQTRLHALHVADSALTVEDEARRHVREDSQELAHLREDLAAIVPGQRSAP
jgi:hypothetical protein